MHQTYITQLKHKRKNWGKNSRKNGNNFGCNFLVFPFAFFLSFFIFNSTTIVITANTTRVCVYIIFCEKIVRVTCVAFNCKLNQDTNVRLVGSCWRIFCRIRNNRERSKENCSEWETGSFVEFARVENWEKTLLFFPTTDKIFFQ